MKDFFKNLFYTLMGNAIWVLLAIGFPILWGIVSSITTDSFIILQPYRVWIIVGGVVLVWALLIYLYKRFNKYQPVYDKEAPDFEILSKESILFLKDDERIIFTKRMILKALRDNLEAYYGQYAWTGDDNYTVECKVHGHTFKKIDKPSINQCYKITFNQNLKKNDEITIETDWILSDKNNRMSPIVGSVISEPTDKLILEVHFPKEDGRTRKVFREYFSHSAANHVIESKLLDVDRNGQSKWIVNKPKLLHAYRIRWVD